MTVETRALSREEIVRVIGELWPRKMLYRDCLMPANEEDPQGKLECWLHACAGDLTEAEKVINHVHVPDLILHCPDAENTTSADLWLIAQAYVALLEAEIRNVAPGREYHIEVLNPDASMAVVSLGDGREHQLVDASEAEVICYLRR